MATYGKPAAEQDMKRVTTYKVDIIRLAKQYGFKPSLIAAIGSRETRWLSKFFLGDIDPKTKLPHGHGPMQIDDRSFPQFAQDYRAGKLTPVDGIEMGCKVLSAKLKSIKKFLPQLAGDLQLRAAVAAYNCGEGNVKKVVLAGQDVDSKTTGHDYSRDVLERAEYFEQNGFGESGGQGD